MQYDFGIAWISKADVHFVEMLETACQARSLSFLQITPVNLGSIIRRLESGEITIRALLDRLSDQDDDFLPVIEWGRKRDLFWINPHEKATRARDKGLMHQELFQHIRTPYTIILPPFREQPELGAIDTSPLGATFATKPSQGGGGEGVVVLCTSIDDVQAARQDFPEDRYLLQERIVPVRLSGRSAWFRIIYNGGYIYPFWWDTDAHTYTSVTVVEHRHFRLGSLEEITAKIAGICGLHLFSTEIALSTGGDFHVVDYVNDPLDLTPASVIGTGIPDEVLRFIVEDFVDWLASALKEEKPRKDRQGE